MPFIETNDRTQLFYTDGGTGKPVVFVASAWLSSQIVSSRSRISLLVDFDALRTTVVATAGSDWPWNGYDYDTLADDLAALLERPDLRGVTLVAQSMGGARWFAI
jgi:non-heme chloroperoxidase